MIKIPPPSLPPSLPPVSLQSWYVFQHSPPLDEVEGIAQPQSPQHEEETQDGPLPGTQHQGFGQEHRDVALLLRRRHLQPAGVHPHGTGLVLLGVLQELLDLLQDQGGVGGGQSGPVVEVVEDWKRSIGRTEERELR